MHHSATATCRAAQVSCATASISTSIRGSISELTSTIVIERADRGEELPVGPADLVGARDVGDVNAHLDHVGEAGPRPPQLPLDLLQDLHRLLVWRRPDHRSFRGDRRRPPDDHERPRTHDATEPELPLERRRGVAAEPENGLVGVAHRRATNAGSAGGR